MESAKDKAIEHTVQLLVDDTVIYEYASSVADGKVGKVPTDDNGDVTDEDHETRWHEALTEATTEVVIEATQRLKHK